MGRPLNSKAFGQGPGAIVITFHDGEQVVTGHIVKQTGTRRYIVSADGVNTHEVTLADTVDQAENLVEGAATIAVKDANGDTSYVTTLQSCIAVTTSGTALSWSTDPEADSALAIEVKPMMSSIIEGNLSTGAYKDLALGTIFMGTGNYGKEYNIVRHEGEGLELAMKVHRRNAGAKKGVMTEVDGLITVTVPAEPLVPAGEDFRATWVFDFAVLAGVNGMASTLNDYDLSITMDLNGATVTMVRNELNSWSVGDLELLVCNEGVLESGKIDLLDQNSFNIGYNSMNEFRGEYEEDWAEQAGTYLITLTAKKANETVAELKMKVITDPEASW